MHVKELHIVGCEKEFEYEATQIIRLFIEPGVLLFGDKPELRQNRLTLLWEISESGFNMTIRCSLLDGLKEIWQSAESLVLSNNRRSFVRECKRIRLRLCWKALNFYTGKEPPWGILTGVRPVKVAHELLEEGVTLENIFEQLKKRYCLREDKSALIISIAQKERVFIKPQNQELYSLYFGIPFCPSRCAYCSFPAYTGASKLKLLDSYIDAMIKEATLCCGTLSERSVESLYIGGGTPTVLSPTQLDKLLSRIRGLFDLTRLKECTVEAGRPDTITLEKLQVLKRHGVDRICVNPQTFSSKTLKKIGRDHTGDDIIRCVEMIRSVGFKTLNMDIILGLPGETYEDVENTLKQVKGIAPENLTVHTLAIKKGSELRHDEDAVKTDIAKMDKMLALSYGKALEMNMAPYYMYRQKFMLANLENVGYALPGNECIYNMQIMEEKQDILSFGSGAVSKICFPAENRHERVPNVRGLEEYLERCTEMAERKIRMLRVKSCGPE